MGKRRKTKNKELTQEEIWDDSALIQSWDEAVEEYKLYHSIHARGENVEDVLRNEAGRLAADEGDEFDETSYLAGHDASLPDGEDPEDGEVREDDFVTMNTNLGEMGQPRMPKASSFTAQPRQEAGTAGTPATGQTTKGPNMPQALLGGVKDEGLKNIMMAWYFAGYYTGLHEGQQQANQQPGS